MVVKLPTIGDLASHCHERLTNTKRSKGNGRKMEGRKLQVSEISTLSCPTFVLLKNLMAQCFPPPFPFKMLHNDIFLQWLCARLACAPWVHMQSLVGLSDHVLSCQLCTIARYSWPSDWLFALSRCYRTERVVPVLQYLYLLLCQSLQKNRTKIL